MIPVTRKELYLNRIVGNKDYPIPEKPITTEEFFFAEILGEAVQAPEPLTRYQMFLAKIAGKDVEIPYPETRLEYFLAKAAGMEIETPTPITREEIFWSNYHAIVDFEVGGIPPLTYKAVASALKDYKICGNTIEGESVGDKTDNIIRDYAVVRTQAQYAAVLFIDTELIPNTTYSFTCLLNSSELRLYTNEKLFNTISYVKDDVVLKVIVKTLSELPDSQKINGKWIMLKNSITEPVVPELSNIMMIKGSEMPAIYEPYGYRVPVTVSNGTDTETTPIYLPEPLKMVGNEPEYIDYREQKQHRVRKNLLNYSSIEIGGFDFSTGEKVPDSSQFRTSTPIKVKPYESYAISGVASGQVRVFLYNGNMNMISTVLRSDNSVVETTGSTVFVNVAGIKSAWSEQIQLEIGSEATGYEPYIEDTELNVTLPDLPTLSGTNILSIGTTVQPSKVYIKGEKEREYT